MAAINNYGGKNIGENVRLHREYEGISESEAQKIIDSQSVRKLLPTLRIIYGEENCPRDEEVCNLSIEKMKKIQNIFKYLIAGAQEHFFDHICKHLKGENGRLTVKLLKSNTSIPHINTLFYDRPEGMPLIPHEIRLFHELNTEELNRIFKRQVTAFANYHTIRAILKTPTQKIKLKEKTIVDMFIYTLSNGYEALSSLLASHMYKPMFFRAKLVAQKNPQFHDAIVKIDDFISKL